MTRFKNIRSVIIFILLLVLPSSVMAISWTAMPGLGDGQYNSMAVEDFNKDGYKDIAGVKGNKASIWQQSLSWICPASLYSWSYNQTDLGPTFSAIYNAIAAGDLGSGPGNSPNLKPDGMPDTVVATTGGIYIFYGNSLDTWNSTPPAKGANTGYGRMSGVGTNSSTPADNWTVQCTSKRTVSTNLPQYTQPPASGGVLSNTVEANFPYPSLLNQGDTYRFTFSNLSTASGVNPKKAFTVKKGELPVGEGRVDQTFTTIDGKVKVYSTDWSNTNLILPDETIDLTINSVTPAAFSVTGATTGARPNATADVAYSDAGTGLSFTVSEDRNAGFIAGDKFTFTTYATADNIITGSATDVVSLRLADVDNDGELEIIAGTQSGIEVYNYNGAWSTMNTNLPTTGEWRGIAVRDMNRDGNMDIVAASTTAGVIKAWYGDGAGNWTVADDLTTSAAVYYSLDVEDINRDGLYDIVAGVGDAGIEVWLGDSNGNFTQGRKPTGTDRYYDVKIADINYDYKPDIIGAQWGGGIPVWLGDGTGEWWLPETEPIETGDYRAITVTDVNNDGLPDVAGASYGGGVDVFVQSRIVDPSINWAKASFPTASGDFQGTAVGDFNRDGNHDVVVAGNASGVRVFYGDGKSKVQASSYIYNGYTGTGNGTISITKTDDTKTGTEDWSVKCVTGGANPVFEVSRNGVPEAALYSLPGTYTHSGTGVSFVIYPGTTNFAVNDTFTFRTIEGGITTSGIYYGVVTADFNNDGILDVAAASNGGGGINIWYGNGEGEWDSVPPTDALWDGNAESENIGSGNYYYLAVGDVNSDGKPDLVGGSDATGVQVFLNDWNGTTITWPHNSANDPATTGSYAGVALADFDNDGNLDIAAGNRGGDGVMVWLGNGDGSFNTTNTGPDFSSSVILTDEYGMGRKMTYYYDGIAAADFDRDGNMDIVAGNLGGFGVQVFYGDGDKLRHGHVTWNLSNVTPPVPSCSNSGDVYVQDLAASSYGQTYYGEYGSFGKDIYIGGTKVRAGVTTSDYVTGDSDVTLTAHQPTEDEPWDFTDSCSGGGISIDFPSSGCSNGLILRGSYYSYDPPDLLYFSTYNPGVTTSGQYYGIATGDLNKDGYPDVVAANKNNGGIQIWLNGGSKSFYRVPEALEPISSVWASATDPVVNGNYKDVEVLDFNRDGNLDILGTHDFTGGIGAEIWLNSVDIIPPTVALDSLSPESGATDVSTGASISAKFSEDVDILTLRNNDTNGTFSPSSDSTITAYGSKSGFHAGVINYDSTTFTLTFYPDTPFMTNEIVTVTFSSKIVDSAGNHLDGNEDGSGSDTPSDYYLWSFTIVDTVKPLPPTAVTGTAGEGKAILSWTAPVKNEDNSTLTDLAGFNVYRGNVSGGPYFKINSSSVSKDVVTYTDSPLTNGATYYYVVTAVDQYGNESVNSTPQVSVTPALDTVKPSAPASFAATAGNKKVTLTWTAPTTNVDGSTLTDLAGYWLYRGTASGVYGSGPINSVLIPASTVEYIDTTAANGTTYYYAVTAVDSSISSNESAKSNEASAAPYLDVTAPDAPSSVTATGGAAEIILSWTVPAAVSDFNSYKIYRHTVSFTNVTDTGVTLVATISNYNTTSWKDTASNGLVIDTTYYYRITSTDTNGNESTPSNQVNAVPLNPVGALGLSSNSYIIPADGVSQAIITAIAQSPLGYPVADGTTINFSVSCSASECGTLSDTSATTSGGKASVTITSSTILTNSVTITASSGTVSGSTTVAFKPGPASLITMSASPSSIPADGISTSTITATIKDSGGNSVKDGLYVTFTTTIGTFPNGTTTSDPVATSGGTATVALKSGASGTPTITATVGATKSGTPVVFSTALVAAPTNLVATSENQQVTLSWTASASLNVLGYNVYRTTTSGSGYVRLNDALVTATTYTSTALTNDKKYYYVVEAVNTSGNVSSYSSEVSAVPTWKLVWTKSSSNPVLDVGKPGDWDDMNVGKATVILDGTTYKMWYIGSSYSDPAGKVGYATSTDGITWTKYGTNPVLSQGASGAWDDVEISDCNVVKDGTTYKMWYTATGDWIVYKIGYATSSDGITWTKDASNPILSPTSSAWDSFKVERPSVIKDGTTYKMWYKGYNGSTYKIGYATSADGVAWTKSASNPVLSATSGAWDSSYVSAPAVVKDTTDNVFKMWYFGTNGTSAGIGYAVSADGISWNKHTSSPVLALGATGAFDDSVISAPAVWSDNTTFKMWYTGGDGYNQRVGYASTVQDSQPPTITTFSPGSGATGIAKDANISITFSEDMDESTLNASNITVSGSTSGAIGGLITYDSSTNTATFNPDAEFQTLEIITVKVKAYARDLAGNTLDGDADGTAEGSPTDDKTWTFTIKDTLPPSAPTGLTATAGNGQVALSWTAPTTNKDGSAITDLQGYNVYRSTTSGSGYTKVTTSVLTSASYSDTGVTNGTTYYYIVKAVDTAANESDASAEANATPVANPAPAAPTGLQATVAGLTSVSLTWTANTESNLSGYKVYQSTTSGSGYTLVTTLGKVTSYQVTGLTAGTTYYFVVTAIDTSNYESSYSSEVSARPGLTGDVDGALIGGKLTVDGADLIVLAASFGSSKGETAYNQYADLNGDGVVDGKDLGILGRNFGRTS